MRCHVCLGEGEVAEQEPRRLVPYTAAPLDEHGKIMLALFGWRW